MRKIDFNNKEEMQKIYKKTDSLFEEARILLNSQNLKENDEKIANLYNSQTNIYLREKGLIMLPLPKEEWDSRFTDLHYDSNLQWPQHTAYNYINDVIMPPLIPKHLLNFGYAGLEGKLIKTAFFATMNFDGNGIPQEYVIDPFANQKGINPEFYIGVQIPQEDIENFRFSREKGHPLEVFVKRKRAKENEERIHQSKMDSYHTQMTYSPGTFSDQLMQFALKEGLRIPNSFWNNEKREAYEKKDN